MCLCVCMSVCVYEGGEGPTGRPSGQRAPATPPQTSTATQHQSDMWSSYLKARVLYCPHEARLETAHMKPPDVKTCTGQLTTYFKHVLMQ